MTFTVLNKLHEQETKFKRELAKNFLEYLDSLPINKRIEQFETILYERTHTSLATVERRLTPQEKKCIFLASKGKVVKEMASILSLSQRTIKYHKANITKKLEVPNFMAAVALVMQLQSVQNENLTSQIIPASIYWKDRDGFYLGNNNYAKNLMKCSGLEAEVIGKTDYDLFSKEVADNFKKTDLKVLSGENLIVEEVTILPNYIKMIQLSSKMPLFDKNKNIVGISGISLDITKLKNLN